MGPYYIITDGKGKEIAIPIKDGEDFVRLRNAERNLELLKKVREEEDDSKRKSLKKDLLGIMYQGYPNDDGSVRGAKERLTRRFVLDIDDKDEADRVILEVMNNLNVYEPLLIERSASYGAHFVFPRPWGMSILEAQCEMALRLHAEIDLNNKNANRKLFTTSASAEDLIYFRPELFTEVHDEQAWARERSEMSRRKPDLPDMPVKGDKHYKVWEHNWPSHGVVAETAGAADAATTQTQSKHITAQTQGKHVATQTQCNHTDQQPTDDDSTYPTDYMGIPYELIVSKYWEQNNNGKEPTVGNRNSLTFNLARDLAPICDYNPRWLEQLIPRYESFPEQEWRTTIANGCSEEHRGMRYATRKAVEEARKEMQIKSVTGGTALRPPEMPRRLIAFHRALISLTPKIYRPTVCEGVWQALAAHLHGVRFRYIDGTLHEPHSFGLLVAPMSSGKGCINKPIEFIMADIVERDAVSRKREAEWKRKNPVGSKKQPRPADICIQMLMSDVTHAAFVLRVTDADANGERAVYMHVDEVELLNGIKGNGKGDSVFAYIKTGYDTARIGQERVGAESVDGNAPLRWDCNASSTPARARAYFRSVVNDGTLSRMYLNTIIVPEDNSDIPVYGIYDEKYGEALKPYIDRLNEASGEINCPQAQKLVREIDKENKDRADEYDNEAYGLLSYRANVNAYVKAMILYIINGYKWSKDIEAYIRWSEQWDLWVKMRYFLDYMESDIKAESGAVNQGPCNFIAALPPVFTYQQFLDLRRREGKQGDGKAVLRKWKQRGFVEYNEDDDTYIKIGKYAADGIK